MLQQEKLNQLMQTFHLEGFLLYSPQNRYWYSRFPSSLGYLLVTKKGSHLFLDGRYFQAAKEKEKLAVDQLHLLTNQFWSEIKALLNKEKITKLGFESDWLTYEDYQSFQKQLAPITLVPVNTKDLRIIKDTWELSKIQKACDLSAKVYQDVLHWIKPGVTEKAVAQYISDRFLTHGADKLSFETIVASGENGAKPHAVPTLKKIKTGELVTLDMGCYVDGYVSDQTRTFAVGVISEQLRAIYEAVYEAQNIGIKMLKPGQNAGEIHQAVAQFLTTKGYEKYFNHGLGHGMGIEIHEEPYENATSQTLLTPGMVVTVEPGVYIPGVGGVRIEDDFVITDHGAQKLTTAPRELVTLNHFDH